MLSKLKKVDLRKAWKHEATDFTTWLSEEENLSLLSDELGIGIRLIQTEAKVGKYSVDILAEEENTGKKIIIENQLEATNHDHLGKLITYASGHDASIVVWIVKDVREEHRQAIDWLNDHTDEDVNFFAIKLELWQIGTSPYAPKFQVLSRPNEWAKAIKKSTGQTELTETKVLQYEFWNKFKEYAQNHKTQLRLRKTSPQHWYDLSMGSSNAHLSLTTNTQKNLMGVAIYIPDDKDLFKKLYKYKQQIESEFGKKLKWMELPNKKASRIIIESDADIESNDNWDKYFEWINTHAEKLQKVFSKYVKKK